MLGLPKKFFLYLLRAAGVLSLHFAQKHFCVWRCSLFIVSLKIKSKPRVKKALDHGCIFYQEILIFPRSYMDTTEDTQI